MSADGNVATDIVRKLACERIFHVAPDGTGEAIGFVGGVHLTPAEVELCIRLRREMESVYAFCRFISAGLIACGLRGDA